MRLFRRFLLLVGIVALLGVLTLPVLVGRGIAQLASSDALSIDQPPPGFSVSTERATSAWFNSHYQHRLSAEPDALRAMLGDLATQPILAGRPVAELDTTVHHGPIAFGALSYTWRALWPAIARTRSKVRYANAAGDWQLPLTIDTSVSLTGTPTVHVRSPAFDTGAAIREGRLSGANVEALATTSANGKLREAHLKGDRLALAVDTREARISGLETAVDANGDDYYALRATATELSLDDSASQIESRDLIVAIGVGANQLRIDVAGTLTAPRAAAVTAAVTVDGLSATLLETWLVELTAGQPIDGQRWLRELAAASGQLTVDVDGEFEQQRYALVGDIALQPVNGEALAILAGATGQARLTLDAGLVRQLAQSGLRLPWLSYLKRDGERYVLDAELAAGTLSLNGAVFPLAGAN
ncbi:MAG: DUF945 family protein [Pseudomonadota bacterium]